MNKFCVFIQQYKLALLILFLVYSVSAYSQVMVLDAQADNSVKFDFEFSQCLGSTSPIGWSAYIGTPDCASSRGAIMYPVDVDDEAFVMGEALKRDISSFGLIAGTTVTVSIVAGVGNSNNGAYIYPGNHEFKVRIYNSDPGFYSVDDADICIYDGGQLILSGTASSLTGVTYTNTITLTQNANWIAVGGCSGASWSVFSDGGNVFDDLEMSWTW